jgi:hypothetical protein
MDTFPYLHNDDLGNDVVGHVYGKPVILYYPEAAEAREAADRKRRIQESVDG